MQGFIEKSKVWEITPRLLVAGRSCCDTAWGLGPMSCSLQGRSLTGARMG